MKAALTYASTRWQVTAWPNVYSDKTIYALRRNEYVDTFVGGIQMAQVVFGRQIVDRITAKGRRALGIEDVDGS